MQTSSFLEGGATSFLFLPTSLLAEMCRACWYEITNCFWFLKILLCVPYTKLPPSSVQQPVHVAPFGTANSTVLHPPGNTGSAAPCLRVTGTTILTSNKKELCQRLLHTGWADLSISADKYLPNWRRYCQQPALWGLCNHSLEDSSQLTLWELSPKLANIAREGIMPLSAMDVTSEKWGWGTLELVYE